jgi:hypothetical protein
MHLANALGVPVIGLFGPTNPIRTGPVFAAPYRILQPPGCPPTGGGSLAAWPRGRVAAVGTCHSAADADTLVDADAAPDRHRPAHPLPHANGVYRAVDGVSFSVERGETLGIVGESGSGKSVTCYSIMGLIPQPPGRIESGSAVFDGVDLLRCPAVARSIRGKRVSMIFQDPMTSLNPYLRISEQVIEPLLIHERHLEEGGPRPGARDAGGRRDQRRRAHGSISTPTSSRAGCASG